MKIYTKTGDLGETSLLGGTRVSKAHQQIEAYGTVDELNAFIGDLKDALVLASLNNKVRIVDFLLKIQSELFVIGSHLANDLSKSALKLPKVSSALALEMESLMDEINEKLPVMTHFVLPGGHPLVSKAHICRTMCRRAERRIVVLANDFPHQAEMIQFVNRLSDYFFVLGRLITYELNIPEIKWEWSK